MLPRLGEHSEVVTKAFWNWTPCAAIRSRLGKLRNGKRRFAPKRPEAMSSATTTTKFGRERGARAGTAVGALAEPLPPQPSCAHSEPTTARMRRGLFGVGKIYITDLPARPRAATNLRLRRLHAYKSLT